MRLMPEAMITDFENALKEGKRGWLSVVVYGFASPAVDHHVVLIWSLFGQPLWIRPSTDSTRNLGAVAVRSAESFFLWLELGKNLV